jgi:Spy/CpxP family protein refolding chaperone
MHLPTVKSLLIFAAVATLGTGALLAQHKLGRHGRMGAQLGLTDTQKSQARTIFQNSRQTARPVADQLRQDRQALQAAIQAGKSDQELQQLAAAQGADMGKLAGIRASAAAKFRALLTPEQQQKLDTMKASRRGQRKAARAAASGE